MGESPPDGTDDMCTPNSEKKEDNVVIGNEENEWDRLLRVRLGASIWLHSSAVSYIAFTISKLCVNGW